jgi:hypothetical protein
MSGASIWRRGAPLSLIVCLWLGASGCDQPAPSSADPVDVAGSVSLALQVGGGIRIDAVDYDVSGNGFHASGRLAVDDSTIVSAVIGGIPLGSGYVVALNAMDVDHRVMSCHGSAPFDLTTATTVPVTVHMTCHESSHVTVPPPAVPLPPAALLGLAGLLLAVGAQALRRTAR